MIVLVGFMGAGKTQVGSRLARRLGESFADADHVIAERASRSIAAIFATDGEPAFRTLEHDTIADLLTGRRGASARGGAEGIGVLSLGGGAAMHPGTQELLRRHATTVHLRVSLAQALRRIGDDPARPVLARPDLPDVYAARIPVYDAVADVTVDTDGLDVDAVVDLLIARLPKGSR